MSDNVQEKDFAAQASEKQTGFLSEMVGLLWHYKKWWLAPVVLVMLLVGALVVLAGSSAAPFIYTLF